MTEGVILEVAPANKLPELPEGWEWIRLGNAFSIRSGAHDPAKTPEEIFSLYSMPAYDTGSGPEICYGKSIGSTKAVVQKGDLLLSKLNPRIPRVWYVGDDSSRRKLASTDFLPLVAQLDSDGDAYFDISFARLLLLSNIFRQQVSGDVQGATGSRQRLRKENVFDAFLPRPKSLDIQRRIVVRTESLMDDLKDARELLDEMMNDTNRLMNTALAEVFGNMRDGFNVINVPQSEIKQIEDIAKVERGKFSPRPRNDPSFFGGQIPWIQIQNLPKNYSKYITTYMNTLNERGLAVSRKFPKGTLVLSIAATIGSVGILEFDACFPDSLVGITPIDYSSVDSGFLFWQLLFIGKYLEQIAPSAAQKNINLQILRLLNLWIPDPSEQQFINTYFDSVQSDVDVIWKMLSEHSNMLNNMEQSILEQVFKGDL